MSENQASIEAWRLETFGPPASVKRIAARANEEMAELLRALSLDDRNTDAIQEIADVMIVLYGVAEGMKLRLDDLMLARLHPSDDHHGNFHLATVVNGFLSKALIALGLDDPTHIVAGHVRDVLYGLRALAVQMETDLQEEVDRKMAINRKRQWLRTDQGHGQHVPEATP